MVRTRARSSLPVLVLVLVVGAVPVTAHQTTPVPPCDFVATPASTTSVQLFWSDLANNETSYRVETREPGGPFMEIASLPAGSTSATVVNLHQAIPYDFRVRSANGAGFSAYTPTLPATTDYVTSTSSCTSQPTAPCVNNNRYRVRVDFATQSGQSGLGNGQKLGGDSAAFTFFNPDNQELLVKVLNGCGVNNRYWVFASGLTNVQVTVTVTDTQRGRVRSYFNPQGKAFAPVQDTAAFATCP
jgi:hypothetical protein